MERGSEEYEYYEFKVNEVYADLDNVRRICEVDASKDEYIAACSAFFDKVRISSGVRHDLMDLLYDEADDLQALDALSKTEKCQRIAQILLEHDETESRASCEKVC